MLTGWVLSELRWFVDLALSPVIDGFSVLTDRSC